MTLQATTNLEGNLEAKLGETRDQETREKEETAKIFKDSPEGKKIQNALAKGLKGKLSESEAEEKTEKLFERIATNYSNKKPSERENVIGIVEEVCQSKLDMAQLGLLEATKDPQFITNIKKEYSGKNSDTEKLKGGKEEPEQKTAYDTLPEFAKTPEFNTLERLVDQGHISEKDFEEFKKKNAESDEITLKENMQKLVSGIKDEDTKKKIHEQFFGAKEKSENLDKDVKEDNKENETKTAEDIKGTDFYKDWGNLIEGDRQISDVELKIAGNYLSIKDVSGKGGDKKGDLDAALSTTGKEIIKEQNPEFRQINAKDIETVLNANEDIKNRYQAIERLYAKSEAQKGKNKKVSEINQKNNQAQQQAEQQQQQFTEGQKISIAQANDAGIKEQASRENQRQREEQERQKEMAQMGDVFGGSTKLDTNNTVSSAPKSA